MEKAASSMEACQFKRMNSDDAGAVSSNNVERCATFKPLYSGEANKKSCEQSSDDNDPEALLQEAYQNGFQKGQQHGCQEALAQAKVSLSPGLTAFINSYNQLLDQRELSKSTTSDNVMELAFLIVDKILDQSSVVMDQDLTELMATITDALIDTNRLSLNMNPEDFGELESILSEDGLDLTSHPQIAINKNSALQPGELRVDVQSEAIESVDQKILDKLTRILANP